jgi:hypothetical protein
MTEVTFTFRLDLALKAAFTAIAEDQDLSAAHLLRRMMREAVEDIRKLPRMNAGGCARSAMPCMRPMRRMD